MRGTNTGPFAGLPASGRTVELRGADFIQVTPDGIRSVHGYFDSGDVPRQLGLQIVVQPNEIGPFTLGTSACVRGSSSEQPGAFSITSLTARHLQDKTRVQGYSRQIAAELPAMNGFLGWVGVTVGERMLTITAWKSPEDARSSFRSNSRILRGRVCRGRLDERVDSASCQPADCSLTACGTMVRRPSHATHCECGAAFAVASSYW